jgi:hypothetical protein
MVGIPVSTAYLWTAVVAVVFFLVAVIAANLILFKPNNPGTIARRIWFWILAVLTPVVGFVVNNIYLSSVKVSGEVTVTATAESEFMMHSGIAAGAFFVLFIVLGFVLSKIFKTTKVGTWF